MAEALALLSWRPAAILGVEDEHGGPIVEGGPANLVVFDPNREWVVEPSMLASRSRNTPYAGRVLRGKVRHTVLRGEPVVVEGEAQR
jgi:dihydroorotase